jgi:hypothetical protein
MFSFCEQRRSYLIHHLLLLSTHKSVLVTAISRSPKTPLSERCLLCACVFLVLSQRSHSGMLHNTCVFLRCLSCSFTAMRPIPEPNRLFYQPTQNACIPDPGSFRTSKLLGSRSLLLAMILGNRSSSAAGRLDLG